MHPSIATRILRLAYEEWIPDGSMTKEQTEDVLRAAAGEENVIHRFTLAGGITAEIRPDTICFAKTIRTTGTEEKPEETFRCLTVPYIAPGESVVLDWGSDKILLSRESFCRIPENFENIYNLSIQQTINFATIKGVLCLRTRKAGDTVLYHGMHRKLRRLQSEFHILPGIRDTMPLLTDEEEILWGWGLEPCDKVRQTDAADNLLHICCFCPAPSGEESR